MPSWFIIVDLPEPDGPMIATNSFLRNIKRYMIERGKVTTLQMVVFVTSVSRISGMSLMSDHQVTAS